MEDDTTSANVETRLASPSFPSWLSRREDELIASRRLAAHSGDGQRSLRRPRVALALSGGGIRSATFALGVLQGLARRDLLKHFDYLSTVSGGGYIGAFFGALYLPGRLPDVRAEDRGKALTTTERVTARLRPDTSNESFAVWWLRQNGRYLAPTRGANLLMFAILLRNWISVLVNLSLPVMTAFFLEDALRAFVPATQHTGHFLLHVSGVELWCSPLSVLPALCVVVMLPLGTAYWMTPPRVPGMPFPSWAGMLFAAFGSFELAIVANRHGAPRAISLLLFGLAGMLIAACLAWFVAFQLLDGGALLARQRLTMWLKAWLALFLGTLLCATIDTLGQTLFASAAKSGLRDIALWLSPIAGAAAGTAAFGNHIISFVRGLKRSSSGASKINVPTDLLLLVVGVALASLLAVGAASAAHCLAWRAGSPDVLLSRAWVVSCAGFGVLLTLICSWVRPFLNNSSLLAFYSARLTRTFLGASNPKRRDAERSSAPKSWIDPSEVVPGDEISLHDYTPHAQGGPLHIINITLNETVDGRSNVDDRDRKGLPLALSPAAVSVGVRHHAERQRQQPDPRQLALLGRGASGAFEVFPRDLAIRAEALSLGRFIAISGAAVAPGAGAGTSLGAALTSVFLNLRLGQWWYSGTDPYAKALHSRAGLLRGFARAFPVLSHFIDEATAHFHGTARREWYLSDGGHFENTGCYELLRRRVPIIVCSDAGADPDYAFADLANLVRKARVDFATTITFLEDGELDGVLDYDVRAQFGPLEQLQRTTFREARAAGAKTPHAALARVEYPRASEDAAIERGWLVLIKPTLCGTEPLDIRQYAEISPEFPQQSTADQFFDEAQWESYRKLGEHIGTEALKPDAREVHNTRDFIEHLIAKLEALNSSIDRPESSLPPPSSDPPGAQPELGSHNPAPPPT